MTKKNKVVLINIRGVKTSFFNKHLKSGTLVNIAKYLKNNGTRWDMVSYPGTNRIANQASYFTGKTPSYLNISTLYTLKKSSRQTQKPEKNLSRIVRNDDQLLLRFFNKSGAILVDPIMGRNTLSLWDKYRQRWWQSYAERNKHWEMLDRISTSMLTKYIGKDYDFLRVSYRSSEKLAKMHGPESEQAQYALELIDFQIGRIFEYLEKKNKVDDTLVILQFQAAFSEKREELDLCQLLEKSHEITCGKPGARPGKEMMVLQSGNALAGIYLKPQSGNWQEQARFNENDKQKHGLAQALTKNDGIEHVMYRSDKDKIKIYAGWGTSQISWNRDRLFYKVLSGNDPFNLNQKKTALSAYESYDHTINSRYPDVLYQVRELFRMADAPDIILNAKRGYVFGQNSKSILSFGSLNTEHQLLPVFTNVQTGFKVRRPNDLYHFILRQTREDKKAAQDEEKNSQRDDNPQAKKERQGQPPKKHGNRPRHHRSKRKNQVKKD